MAELRWQNLCDSISFLLTFLPQETSTSLPGGVFLFSAAITLIPLSLSIYILASLKGRKLTDVTIKEKQDDDDQGSILRNSITAENLFVQIWILKYLTILHPKTADIHLSDYN
jgi:hypothetical protein